jgi:hypothetical protein
MEQWNQIENLEMNPYKCSQLIFDKEANKKTI